MEVGKDMLIMNDRIKHACLRQWKEANMKTPTSPMKIKFRVNTLTSDQSASKNILI